MDKERDKQIPLLHIYPQKYPYDDVVIVSSRGGLLKLAKTIEKALNSGESECIAATSDLVSYEIKMILNEENWETEFWNKLQLPFSDDDGQDEGILSVDDIIGYGIRNSGDIRNAEQTIKADQKKSKELTDKVRQIVKRNKQME